MATRLNRKQDERTRNAIKTTQLIKRLQAFALGEIDPQTKKPVVMSSPEIRAAEIVLRKTLPDLSAVELTGDATHSLGAALASIEDQRPLANPIDVTPQPAAIEDARGNGEHLPGDTMPGASHGIANCGSNRG